LEQALPPAIEREPIPYEAAFLAAKAFTAYRRRAAPAGRTSLLPDFYIGAHAAIRGYQLLTRDVARYRTYFPKVRLIAPAP
jgi:predicted nucleic acid-binding protein